MLATRKETLEGKICLVSGSGNVAQYTVEKLLDLGAKPITLSDSDGYIYDERRHRPRETGLRHGAEERPPRPHPGVRRQIQERHLHAGRSASSTTIRCGTSRPMRVPERHAERNQRQGRGEPAAQRRVRGRRRREHADARSRRSSSSSTPRSSTAGQGRQRRRRRDLGPGDGAEQHALAWTREEVDDRLHKIMNAIHRTCVETADEVRHARQSRERRQHRRLPEGRQRDDGSGAWSRPS